MTIKIERRVPPPDRSEPLPPYAMPRKYPWPDMRHGDHISVPSRKEARSAHNSFQCHKRTKHSRISPGAFVTMRKQLDGSYILWFMDHGSPEK
jgi:hypothetical protein